MTLLERRWHAAPVATRINVLIAVVLISAVGGVAGATVRGGVALPARGHFLVILVLFPLAELALLRIRYGVNHLTFTWADTAAFVAFSVAPVPWVATSAGLTCIVVHLLCRRGLQKATFNGASLALSLMIGGAVLGVVGDGAYTVTSVGDILALSVACLVFSAVSSTLNALVVSIAQEVPFWEVLRGGVKLFAIVCPGNLVLAGFILFLYDRSPATLVALPPLALAAYGLNRAYLSAMQERDVWQQLEASSRELNRLDEEEVAAAVLARAELLFRCDAVELALAPLAGRPARVYRTGIDGSLVRGPASHDDLLGRGHTELIEVAEDAVAPLSTFVVAPLEAAQGRIGALRLCFSGRITLSRRERQVLSTFAHTVSSTILNAGLHEEVRAEAARHAHEASHDALTGLANRLLLQERTAAALSADEGETTALLLLDLDHFKEINDTLGHAAGDLLLQEVARRLSAVSRPDDLVARLGGDEFAVLLTGLGSPDEAEPVAERLLRKLSEPVEFEGLRLSVEGSLGVACHPADAGTAVELFRAADVAMYQAKSARGSWLRYSIDRDDSSVYRLALVAELRTAIELDQIVVHYQPQVDLATGVVTGAEALCRWEHPTRGLLAPAEFVGVAEQSGLVRPFTLRVLDQAVAECARWQALGRPVSIAVNLAARSLLDRQLPDDVAAALARHGLPAQRLILEITETTATSELEVVEEVLVRLRRLGVELSVDDFGTGYSSLAFLQRTAVNELKVDRSFVMGLLTSDNDRALVRATIQLAHSLGARAVAEGVEDASLAAALRDLDCDLAQGFWLSKPVPAAALREMLGLTETAVSVLPVPRSEADARRLRSVVEA